MKPVTRWIVLSLADAATVLAIHPTRGAAVEDARRRTADSRMEHTALFQIVPPIVALLEFDQLLFKRIRRSE